MDIPTLLIRIAGVGLFGWTIRSTVLNFKNKSADSKKDNQANSEKALNATLFYLWLAFMYAFSIGMVINN